MPKTRVLIVDDSITVRKRLAEILSADPEIELPAWLADLRSRGSSTARSGMVDGLVP